MPGRPEGDTALIAGLAAALPCDRFSACVAVTMVAVGGGLALCNRIPAV